ncbi:MAG TPA: HIT family hydrolase, partial [Opitutae bacterium]|nr:HIT family hydrolase [Opitutae bacterium]
MPYLHPYWRLNYVEKNDPETGENSPFKDIPNTKDEKAVHLLYRGSHSYLVMNKFPYNPGHLLAVPYNEVDALEKLNKEERADLFDTIIKGQEILTEAMHPQGFNTGFNFGCAAGAGIPKHIHCHIVPRWNG